MKLVSICEREFVIDSITGEAKRMDGRPLSEGRTLDVSFGQEWGCCMVSLGDTRVLAQVSAEVTEPKAATPTEGALHINLELSSMAAPDLKMQGRSSDEAVESQRALERCIRDSKCIDLESLCIVAGSKVWTIRVDLHAINDEGNLVECTSIAAVAALAHFKRPDVTVVGTEVTVYSLEDRDPVPLTIHHMPITVCLALFDQGNQLLIDPSDLEERVANGCYIIGMNAHQEICFVHRRGVLILQEDVIQKCEDLAVIRAQKVTQIIRKALDDDAYKRATKAPVGFVDMLQTSTILGLRRHIHNFDLASIPREEEVVEEIVVDEIPSAAPEDVPARRTFPVPPSAARSTAMKILKEPHASVFEGGASKWKVKENQSESSSEDEAKTPVKKEQYWSSEEEEAAFIAQDQVDTTPGGSTRGWYTKNPFMS